MIPVPFDSANFTATPTGAWIVHPEDQITYEYAVDLALGMVFINWVIGNTNVSGSPTGLRMRLPEALATIRRIEPLMYYTDGEEAKHIGWFDLNPSEFGGLGRFITHYKLDQMPWRNTSGRNTAVHGSAMFSIT